MKKAILVLFSSCLFIFSAAFTATYNSYVRVQHSLSNRSYANTKLAVGHIRAGLKAKYTLKDSALLERYFVHVVVDSIMPYWYGTPWDFNGTTQIPGKGAIACGYFISTVLRDAGLPINRVKMGQMDSEGIIRLLAEKRDTKLFYEKPLSDVMAWLRSHGNGLYIIGLDCHVGFILVDASGCWFIHSKWFGEKAVVKEDAATSNILYYSKYRMVAKISNSKKLLKAWLYGSGL